MNATVVSHSVLTDPAFAKMHELKHAKSCDNAICAYPSCNEAKFLLKHVERCKKDTCKYQHCLLAKVLLDHSAGLHRNVAGCPLCRKHAILKRLHPGKAPRTSETEEEEEEEEKEKENEKREEDDEMEEGSLKERKIARPSHSLPVVRHPLRLAPAPNQHPKRAVMMELLHSNKCRKVSCTEPHCAPTKRLLYHIKECGQFPMCHYPGCVVGWELMAHFRGCQPFSKQCPICDKQPPPRYTGEDDLSAMPALVLRNIFRKIQMDSHNLRPLTQVNRRFRHFLRDEKELRGLCEKAHYRKLTIEQVGDAAVSFHFTHKEGGSGRFYVLSTAGASEEETISYDEKHSVAAKEHINTKYPRCPDSRAPIRIPPEFYDELAIAMLKEDFMRVELRSIILDFDFFDFFITKMNDIFPVSRILLLKNIRIEPTERLTKAVSEDFEAVLDIRTLRHLCKKENKKEGEEKEFTCNCEMNGFLAIEEEVEEPKSKKSKDS